MSDETTSVRRVDPKTPDDEAIDVASDVIGRGGLVAFPTETVYGLGADALNSEAVKRIFDAKGRPATNPLIVHVASIDRARGLAADWPDAAQRLARAFWPGPLTMVVRRSPQVPDEVCAGLDTVALRMPAHPVARALIETSGCPLAAPSANRYTELSPTTAEHVRRGLGRRVDLILDGGPTSVGLESTLVSVVQTPITLLRPGMIDRRQLSAVVPTEAFEPRVVEEKATRQSPGLSERHYSPDTSLRAVEATEFASLVDGPEKTQRVVVGIGDGDGSQTDHQLPAEPDAYARQLYALLHELDRRSVDEIVVEMPPSTPQWEAIRDRLRRAAS